MTDVSWRANPVRSPDFTASPLWRVVELDSQQVPHTSLCRVVNDELIVQQGVTVVFTHPCLHPRPHWHSHTIPEKKRERGKQTKSSVYFRTSLGVLTHWVQVAFPLQHFCVSTYFKILNWFSTVQSEYFLSMSAQDENEAAETEDELKPAAALQLRNIN